MILFLFIICISNAQNDPITNGDVCNKEYNKNKDSKYVLSTQLLYIAQPPRLCPH